MGVTGDVAKNGNVWILKKDINKCHKFSADIDNMSCAQGVSNFMIGAMKNHKGDVVGVAQLMNKATPITDSDVDSFKEVLKMLGVFVVNTKEISIGISITVGLKNRLNDLITSLKSSD